MHHADLHLHSRFSDGHLSPADLMHAAHAAGVTHLALTDHDTLDGLPDAEPAAQALGLCLLRGIELSTQWMKPRAKPLPNSKPISLHVVGLGLQNLAPMHAVLVQQQQTRADRAQAICQKLQKYCPQDPWPAALALADGRAEGITRAHLAEVLLQQGVVQRHQQAFDRFLGDGKPAHVPLQWMSLAAAIDAIRACGGVAVLAHPTRYGLSATHVRHLLAEFAQLGGQAVELPPANDPPSTRSMIDRLAEQHGLALSTASDFHGAHMPWLRLGHTPKLKDGQRHVLSLLGYAEFDV